LAPTLEKLNSVTAMLEKNRDNISKALPGLAKFEITVGEAISSMYAYSAFAPNAALPELFGPFMEYLWGFRTFDTGRGPGFPSTVPRSLVPQLYNGIPECAGCTLGGRIGGGQ
jgi:phospholipid/cholesterol/gamma-HCH transport system substrate-binding protein